MRSASVFTGSGHVGEDEILEVKLLHQPGGIENGTILRHWGVPPHRSPTPPSSGPGSPPPTAKTGVQLAPSRDRQGSPRAPGRARRLASLARETGMLRSSPRDHCDVQSLLCMPARGIGLTMRAAASSEPGLVLSPATDEFGRELRAHVADPGRRRRPGRVRPPHPDPRPLAPHHEPSGGAVGRHPAGTARTVEAMVGAGSVRQDRPVWMPQPSRPRAEPLLVRGGSSDPDPLRPGRGCRAGRSCPEEQR